MRYILLFILFTACSAGGESKASIEAVQHDTYGPEVSSCEDYTWDQLLSHPYCTDTSGRIVCATDYGNALAPIDGNAKWFFRCINNEYVGHYNGTEPTDPIQP